jgi:hypothetical protein
MRPGWRSVRSPESWLDISLVDLSTAPTTDETLTLTKICKVRNTVRPEEATRSVGSAGEDTAMRRGLVGLSSRDKGVTFRS